MPHGADGRGNDQLDLGRAEGGGCGEMIDELKAGGSVNSRIFVSDVKADVPIG